MAEVIADEIETAGYPRAMTCDSGEGVPPWLLWVVGRLGEATLVLRDASEDAAEVGNRGGAGAPAWVAFAEAHGWDCVDDFDDCHYFDVPVADWGLFGDAGVALIRLQAAEDRLDVSPDEEGAPVTAVVQAIESMLVEARAGRLRSVAAVGEVPQGSFHALAYGKYNSDVLIGLIERLKVRLVISSDYWHDDEDEELPSR